MNLGLRQILMNINNSNNWIELNKTFVDLEYIPTQNTMIETEMILLGPPWNSSTGINSSTFNYGSSDAIIGHLGTSDSNDWRFFSDGGLNNGNIAFYNDIGSSRIDAASQSFKINLLQKWFTLTAGCENGINKFNVFYDGNNYSRQTSVYGSCATSITLKLGGDPYSTSSNNNKNTYCTWCGFKYIKIFENSTLVRYFKPAIYSGNVCFKCELTDTYVFGVINPLILHKK